MRTIACNQMCCSCVFISNEFKKMCSISKQLLELDFYHIASKRDIAAFQRNLQLYKSNIMHFDSFNDWPLFAVICMMKILNYMVIVWKMCMKIYKLIPTSLLFSFKANVADIDISLQLPIIELLSDEIIHLGYRDRKHNMLRTNDIEKVCITLG